MTIEKELVCWDGKSADGIRSIYDRHAQQPTFLPQLIKYARARSLQKGATWLLKQHSQKNTALSKREVQSILQLIPVLDGWEAKLHLLQCLPHLKITTELSKTVESFVRECIANDNKFVRAWGYGGFYELARQHPTYQDEAMQLIEAAKRDEPPSVQARIRRVLAKGF